MIKRYCIISQIFNNTEKGAKSNANPPVAHPSKGFTTGATFQTNSTKLYLPVVTLRINDVIKTLENIKQGFEITSSSIK